MNDKQIKLVLGSLLHDTGKVLYRAGDGRNHSSSGYNFIKEKKLNVDVEILDCIRYHHTKKLRGAKIADDSLAYIACFADNVSAAIDRRENGDGENGFDKEVPLDSVFNILNGNNGREHYEHVMLDGNINYPTCDSVRMHDVFYGEVEDRIGDCLKGIDISEEYINSLLSVLEATLSYIPSSTSNRERVDISLFDHVKMTAAIAECTLQYMDEKRIFDYKAFLLDDNKKNLWDEKMYLLYSMDMSGIQSFIYTISSGGALRSLRARSFYLEIMMEHIVDELLDKLALSRSCLIYTGGGHAYMLVPNTETTLEKLETYLQMINEWFLQHFDIALYMAHGYESCSANNLKNEPHGSFGELFRKVSRKISEKKSHRYSASEILQLNARHLEGKNECCVCHRPSDLNEDGKCSICDTLERLSGDILYKDYFVTLIGDEYLPLPGYKCLVACDAKKLVELMETDEYVRSYTVNKQYTGKHVTTKIWVGNYTSGDTFEGLGQKAIGIDRIAVLRADVDSLGDTFVSGFKEKDGGRYETISRTATLSRQLSLFFKLYLNQILKSGDSHIFSESGQRNACIVYSGGDDIFLVGAWNEVIDIFIDIRKALEEFTGGTLTLSAGIGIYDTSYPINRMANEVERLELYSKELPDKNAITIFDEGERYEWQTFYEEVIEEKYKTIYDFMTKSKNYGKVFLYNILELIRDSSARFNRARFVYYLSRMEPDRHDEDASVDMQYYSDFSSKMYKWSQSVEDRRQLVTAIYLYVYMQRKKEAI